jgi:hypothetical protein
MVIFFHWFMYSLLCSISENLFAFWRNAKKRTCFVYYFLLISVFFVSYVFFTEYGLLRTDADSARYMLSALIQSEAAVIAVFVSLSMVAVQLMASSYTPRALEVFRKSPDLWLLLASYIYTIIYSIIVLKMIGDVNSEAVPEIHIFLSCSYGFFCFVALVPYTYNVLLMLRPSGIIRILSEEINRETLSRGDPVYPIVEIMRKSIVKYDLETIQEGMKSIRSKSSEIFMIEEFEERALRYSGRLFEEHLSELGDLAVERRDQNSVNELLGGICSLGQGALNQGFLAVAMKAVQLIGNIGTSACEHLLKLSTIHAIELLFSFGKMVGPGQDQLAVGRSQAFVRRAESAAGNLERIAEIAQTNDWAGISGKAREHSEEIRKRIEDYSNSI